MQLILERLIIEIAVLIIVQHMDLDATMEATTYYL